MTTYIEDKVAEVPILTLLGKRTKTVQKKIKSNLKRHKPFFLTTMSLDNLNKETWFIDSWGWASVKTENGKYNRLIGHINNCLEFLDGPKPRWYDPNRIEKRQYTKRNVSRGKLS